jgi:hypothetical protein
MARLDVESPGTNCGAMIPDKVIYTDGRDVTVTDSTFKIKNTAYNISGITKMAFWTIRPDRWPGVLLMVLGAAAAVCGWLGLFPSTMNMQTQNGMLDVNMLALWIGAGLFILGLLVIVLSREKYAVRIATAEGEKNAIVSHRKEYIAQIVDALNQAFNFNTSSSNTYVTDRTGLA